MSYAIPGIYEDTTIAQAMPRDLVFVPRSNNQWVFFLIPLALCGASYMANGIPFFTDLGFLILTILCGLFVTMEFYHFPRRFGIGGLVLYGGTLCWFCQDYFTHWFRADSFGGILTMNETGQMMPAWVIAKAAFLHVFFIMLMTISLNWKFGRWLERLILIVPDPGDERFYIYIVLFLFCFSLCPYFIFNAEVWYMCIYHGLFAGWTGGAQLSVTRTGNLNYNWGAYVAQIMQVGEVGGIVAIVYAIMIANTWPKRLLGIFIWTFNALVSFESGRRGEICFSLLPPIALLFIKYQAQAAALFKKASIKSYIICGLLTLGLQFVVQFQGTFRGNEVGYKSAYI